MKRPQTSPDTEELLRHVTWVRSLVERLVRDPAWRADVEQETWLAALATQPSGLRDARHWLALVARNAVRHRARSEARRAARERDTARAEALPGVDVLSEQAELQRRVVRAVLEMDETLREPLLLHFFHGLSAAEIARRKGCPASTVRDRLGRGLARLREQFEVEFPERRERARVVGLLLLPLRVEATSRLAMTGGFGLTLALVSAAVLIGVMFLRSGPKQEMPIPGPTILSGTDRGDLLAPDDPGDAPPPTATSRVAVPGPALIDSDAAAVSNSAATTGSVVDPNGLPVVGALVTVARVPAYSTEPASIGVDARTDDQGAFQLPSDLRGSGGLRLLAEAEGYAPELVDFDPLARIVLDPAAELRIRVTEAETGRPVPGAQFTAGEFDWRDGRASPSIADSEGRIVFDRARIGRPLYARVAAPGQAFQSVKIDVPGPGPHEVALTLARGASVTIGVFDRARPVPDAELVLDFAVVGRTRADGTFELAGIVVDGEASLEVRHSDYAPTMWRFGEADLVDGRLVRLPVVRGCRVTGTVLDADLSPLSEARVVLRADETAGTEEGVERPPGVRFASQFSGTLATHTDAEGHFEIDRVAPWTRWSSVSVRDPGGLRWTRFPGLRFDAPGQHRELELVFPRGGPSVSGAISIGGEPVRVAGTWSTANREGEFVTDDEGRYAIGSLEGGEVRLSFTVEARGLTHEEVFVLPADGEVVHDVLLPARGVRFAGQILRAGGLPAAGVALSAFDQARPGSSVRGVTDDLGAFELYLESDPGVPLTLLVRHGPLMLSRFPIPAGTEDYELVLPQLVDVTMVAEGETALAVSFRSDGEREFVELPSYSIRDLGAGRFRTKVPAGRVDLRITRETSGTPSTLLEGVTIETSGETQVVVPR